MLFHERAKKNTRKKPRYDFIAEFTTIKKCVDNENIILMGVSVFCLIPCLCFKDCTAFWCL